ncbi:TrmH family RNA methyltransferase [Alkalihalobacterium bogoriense]|uniref:TrmH family RNA methyltransferase n=1 Tax=Alkalihalobacterium bogoriense TaxID=246272 RepID=UPI00047D9D76|nr:RNA methyltransferase [Alkalihalobacterium bogoriense]
MNRIESVKNTKIKNWKKLHTKKGRTQSGQFFIEGVHLVEEALRSTIEIEELVVEETFSFPSEWDIDNLSMTYVTSQVMKELSETETPQGIAAICKQIDNKKKFTRGMFLLIDGVQDPGNVGTLIRTADAVGVTAVILGEGTADMYNSKVIRATQGSLFHVPIYKQDLYETVLTCKQEGIPVYGTALEHASVYSEIPPVDEFALIVGNEGEGVSKKVLEQTDQNLYIPIFGRAESLNVSVATGVLLYHLRKN